MKLTRSMPSYAPKPSKNVPISLRLIHRITGWDIPTVVRVLTEPVRYAPPDDECFYLTAYQWRERSEHVPKPVPALTPLLAAAKLAGIERDAVAALPADLFVFSDALDGAYLEFLQNETDKILRAHDQPDWQPNIFGIEDLVAQVPEPLRTVCSLDSVQRSRTQEQRRSETVKRDSALQDAFDILKPAEQRRLGRKPTKAELCRKLASDTSANPESLTAERIERIVKMR